MKNSGKTLFALTLPICPQYKLTFSIKVGRHIRFAFTGEWGARK
jgi:hypothetical protein